MFQGSLSCPVYSWGTPGLHVWISLADRKPKPPPKLRNSNTISDVPSHGSKELLNSLGVSAMSWGAPGVTLHLKETVHRFWPSCKFSLAKNMHFLLSLMSKGTWMVRTSVWMLQSRPLNVWCRASDAGHSDLSQPSPHLLLTPQSAAGQAVRSSGKDRKLRYFRSERFQRMSHAVLTCHKSSFFSCS